MATVLVSLLAAAIALLGACIAWGQWYTARQKLILDLFEKRSTLIEDVDLALREVAYRRGDFNDWGSRMSDQRRKAKYLFGREVHSFLTQLDDDVYGMLFAHWRRSGGHLTPSETKETTDDIMKGSAAIKRYQSEFSTLIFPYLRMDQKLPRPPYEWPRMFIAWVRHRWHNRPDGTA